MAFQAVSVGWVFNPSSLRRMHFSSRIALQNFLSILNGSLHELATHTHTQLGAIPALSALAEKYPTRFYVVLFMAAPPVRVDPDRRRTRPAWYSDRDFFLSLVRSTVALRNTRISIDPCGAEGRREWDESGRRVVRDRGKTTKIILEMKPNLLKLDGLKTHPTDTA